MIITDLLFPPGSRVWGALDLSPEIAAALGSFLAEFANLEAVLEILCGSLIVGRDRAAWGVESLDDFSQVGRLILGRANFAPRCDIVESLVSRRTLDSAFKERLQNFIKELRQLNAIRNDYAHGTFTYDVDTKLVALHTWVTAANRKTIDRYLGVEELQKNLNRIRSAYDLIKGPDEKWPEPSGSQNPFA